MVVEEEGSAVATAAANSAQRIRQKPGITV
jgi:hypothetical protein